MTELTLRYVSGPDVDALELTRYEILDAVEGALRAQGEGDAMLERPGYHWHLAYPTPELGVWWLL